MKKFVALVWIKLPKKNVRLLNFPKSFPTEDLFIYLEKAPYIAAKIIIGCAKMEMFNGTQST